MIIKAASIYWAFSKSGHSWKQDLHICYPFNPHSNPLVVVTIISYYLHLSKEETGTMKSSKYLGGKEIHEYLSLKMHKKEEGKVFCLLLLLFPHYSVDI